MMTFRYKYDIILFVTSIQGVLPTAVKVSITLPATSSAAEGSYVGVNVVPAVNVPVPELVQFKEL